jgi:phosphatidylglycerophosphate synthase
MVALASAALALDAVDGKVARRTGTVTAVGARFDMEVDAFLVLVLALYDVRLLGGWVLLIGLARYLLVAAGWVGPWLGDPTPPRFWAKVVAAVQGVVLTVAMADVLPRPAAAGLVLVALSLLAESFGRQVWWLVRHARPAASPSGRSITRRILAAVTTVAALALVWFALVGPSDPAGVGTTELLRIPLEALVLLGVVLVLPPRLARPAVLVAGAALGLLAVIRLLDLGFRATLGRPFNPVSDWGYTASFLELLSLSLGRAAGVAVGVAVGAALLGLLIAVPFAVRRLTRMAGRDRAVTYRFVGAFAAMWLVAATVGLQIAPGVPLAAADAADLAYHEVGAVRANLADRQVFRDELAAPVPVAHTQGTPLAGLRGKDVLIVFVESYGRVAVEDPQISPGVNAVLDDGSGRLSAAGFTARSAFLTSPTFGGISWLAHSTVESGMWVDSQQR